uniref:Odorant-binding protein 18 n=1 Tax=Eocanthecona furcellata TaxID=696902 RepID=A0AAT9TZ37_9HEMI
MEKICLIALLVVYISQIKAEMHGNNCEIETNVIESEVNNYRQFKLPQTKEGKCYGACVMKTVSIMNSRGKISSRNVERIAKELNSPEEHLQIGDIKKCSHSANQLNDDCETAYTFMKCLSAHTSEKLAKTGSLISISPPTVTVNLPPVTFVLFQLGGK